MQSSRMKEWRLMPPEAPDVTFLPCVHLEIIGDTSRPENENAPRGQRSASTVLVHRALRLEDITFRSIGRRIAKSIENFLLSQLLQPFSSAVRRFGTA